MDKLYPENVTTAQIAEVEAVVKEPKDTTKVKEFIKELVKEPMDLETIYKAVMAKYVESTDNDDFGVTVDVVKTLCEEIDAEWRGSKE
jgi:DNA-binding ferritin-like protein